MSIADLNSPSGLLGFNPAISSVKLANDFRVVRWLVRVEVRILIGTRVEVDF